MDAQQVPSFKEFLGVFVQLEEYVIGRKLAQFLFLFFFSCCSFCHRSIFLQEKKIQNVLIFFDSEDFNFLYEV